MLEIRASKQHFLGMPVEEFLREHWQKKPLLVRQAFPGYEPPLSPEDLAGLACEESALSRLVQHDRKHDAWRVRSGPFEESEFPPWARATGPCWCRTWTSGTPTSARCSTASASCRPGASTT
jgi:ribosomal protein L16 Arg81 hydroxylase